MAGFTGWRESTERMPQQCCQALRAPRGRSSPRQLFWSVQSQCRHRESRLYQVTELVTASASPLRDPAAHHVAPVAQRHLLLLQALVADVPTLTAAALRRQPLRDGDAATLGLAPRTMSLRLRGHKVSKISAFAPKEVCRNVYSL